MTVQFLVQLSCNHNQPLDQPMEWYRDNVSNICDDPDEQLVQDVRGYMKMHKLSQVTVGQEARISQAVISQWLSLKYHGHNDKVRAQSCGLTAGGTGCSQDACTRWPLQQAGGRNSPTPTTPTVRQTWSVGPMWWRAGWGCTRVAHFGRCAHGSHHGSHHRGRPVSSAGGRCAQSRANHGSSLCVIYLRCLVLYLPWVSLHRPRCTRA